MAFVVESTSSASDDGVDNLTITKPTGVEVGDLLLIGVHGHYLSAATVSGFSVGATYSQNNAGGIPDATVTLLYRIATSDDVSASNYTIALVEPTSLGAAGMMRVSGWSTGNPVYTTATNGGFSDAANVEMGASGLSLSTPTNQLLIAIGSFYSNDSPITPSTFSGYSVTSGQSNPSWTEIIDVTRIVDAGTADSSFTMAYALRNDTSTITAYSFIASAGTSGGNDGFASMLAVICEPQNASGSNTLLSVSPTVFSNAGVTVGTTGTNALLDVSPLLPTQSGKGTQPTQWTERAKNTSTWTNTPKSI
jgi:hypothetical protein